MTGFKHKKAIKAAGIVVLTPVVLFLLFFLLFYFPPFQNWAVGKVTSYASAKTGMEISVAHVNLEFPLNLGVDGIKVIKQNDSLPQVRDTIADIRKSVVDIKLLPLIQSRVDVKSIAFHDMKVNTSDFIHQARIRGNLANLSVAGRSSINWKNSLADIESVGLGRGWLSIELSDTVKKDTTPSTNFWQIKAKLVDLDSVDFHLHMPGDTLAVNTFFGNAKVSQLFLDLGKSVYQARRIEWRGGKLRYDNNFRIFSPGFDYNHVALNNVSLMADSFYFCSPTMRLALRQLSFSEKSGLRLNGLCGSIAMDSLRLAVRGLALNTPNTSLRGNLVMDRNAFAENQPGKFHSDFKASLGKRDLLLFVPHLPSAYRSAWPNLPVVAQGTLKGNLQRMDFRQLRISIPTVFDLRGEGHVVNPADAKHLEAKAVLDAHAYNLSCVYPLLSKNVRATVRIPSGIAVKGRFAVDGPRYSATFRARQGGGSLAGNVNFNRGVMAYKANLQASRLPLQNFLTQKGLHPLTGDVNISGWGTDILSPRTLVKASVNVKHFSYGSYNLDNITAGTSIRNGLIHAAINSKNPLLMGLITLDALASNRILRATVGCDLQKADLYGLRLTQDDVVASFCGHVDLASDLRNLYKVQGLVSDITVRQKGVNYRPEDVVMDVLTRRDTTHAVVDCGDFHLRLDAQGGYRQLLKLGSNFTAELQKQWKERYIDQERLRERLPLCHLYLTSGRDNFFVRMLHKYGYCFKEANIDLASSKTSGLNGYLKIDSLTRDSMQLDTLRLYLASADGKITYHGQVRNNSRNPQYIFNALFDGGIKDNGAYLTSRLYDGRNRLGIAAGLNAQMEKGGIRCSFTGADPILGYKKFHVNDSNFVFLGNDKRVSADMELTASDGTGVKIYSDDDDKEALQDITVSLNRFDLEKVLSVIPYMPEVSGIMNGDFHLIQTEQSTSISSSVSVDNMAYQKCPMGDVSTDFVYMPLSDGGHKVSGIIMSDGKEVGAIDGTYSKDEVLDAKLSMDEFPLGMINGFIPMQLFGFRGYGDGTLSVKGKLDRPEVDGEVYLDSSYIFSQPYGVEMRFANDPITIKGSKLLFENFEMFANNDSPLDVSGAFDFSNLDRMMLNVKMQARNFLLIDSKETPRSETYGKTYVNFFGTMQGPVDNLKMLGRLDVLGSTDMTYVMRDAILTTDNQLNEIVKFADFRDTATVRDVARPPLTGFNMQMMVNIDEGARIMCMLNADHSNYIDLMGGGNLRMSYDINDGLRLTGRYTLNNGEMKYALPIIPLKTFSIQEGSYLEFSGDPMNPLLSITATENVKAMVDEGSGNGRSVDFKCGVKMSKTLSNPGILFIIEAPNDLTIQDELNTMSEEGRGKVAIAMLASGMYLTDGNTKSFSMNSALSSFLQNEINNIAGAAMRSMGLNLGMSVDNSVNANGAMHTDYNFRFSKRVLNNRLNIIIGGKVSTGAELERNQNNTFFDNVQFEYRLDQHSSKYLKLFYNNNVYDWLEGQVGEYGAGFVWKRKLRHFNDIFRFKSDVDLPPVSSKRDTLNLKARK